MANQCDNRSVGIVLKQEDKVLLIARNTPPFGYAAPAGHVDQHGSFRQAAFAELREEVGISATKMVKRMQALAFNECRRPGGSYHFWHIYEAYAQNYKIRLSEREVLKFVWAGKKHRNELAINTIKLIKNGKLASARRGVNCLEPIWVTWFSTLRLIDIDN